MTNMKSLKYAMKTKIIRTVNQISYSLKTSLGLCKLRGYTDFIRSMSHYVIKYTFEKIRFRLCEFLIVSFWQIFYNVLTTLLCKM
jgi:hypothetical protein